MTKKVSILFGKSEFESKVKKIVARKFAMESSVDGPSCSEESK
jgi:hypothetical protein